MSNPTPSIGHLLSLSTKSSNKSDGTDFYDAFIGEYTENSSEHYFKDNLQDNDPGDSKRQVDEDKSVFASVSHQNPNINNNVAAAATQYMPSNYNPQSFSLANNAPQEDSLSPITSKVFSLSSIISYGLNFGKKILNVISGTSEGSNSNVVTFHFSEDSFEKNSEEISKENSVNDSKENKEIRLNLQTRENKQTHEDKQAHEDKALNKRKSTKEIKGFMNSQFFASKDDKTIEERIQQLRSLKQMLIDWDFTDRNGDTLLDFAQAAGNPIFILELIKLGARKSKQEVTTEGIYILLNLAIKEKDFEACLAVFALHKARGHISNAPHNLRDGLLTLFAEFSEYSFFSDSEGQLQPSDTNDHPLFELCESFTIHILTSNHNKLNRDLEPSINNILKNMEEFIKGIPVKIAKIRADFDRDFNKFRNKIGKKLPEKIEERFTYLINHLRTQIEKSYASFPDCCRLLKDEPLDEHAIHLVGLVNHIMVLENLAEGLYKSAANDIARYPYPLNELLEKSRVQYKKIDEDFLYKIKRLMPKFAQDYYSIIREFCTNKKTQTIDFTDANIRTYFRVSNKEIDGAIDNLKLRLIGKAKLIFAIDDEQVLRILIDLIILKFTHTNVQSSLKKYSDFSEPKYQFFSVFYHKLFILNCIESLFDPALLLVGTLVDSVDVAKANISPEMTSFAQARAQEKKYAREQTQRTREETRQKVEESNLLLYKRHMSEQKGKDENDEIKEWNKKILTRLLAHKPTAKDVLDILKNPTKEVSLANFLRIVKELQIPGYEKIKENHDHLENNKLVLNIGKLDWFPFHTTHGKNGMRNVHFKAIGDFIHMLKKIKITKESLEETLDETLKRKVVTRID